MNTTYFEIFLEILKTGTLTEAAENLGYTQSGLTRILNGLDRQMGFPLLYRDRHGVRLTPEGKMMLPAIQNLLQEQRRLVQCAAEISRLDRGLITIGTFNSVSAQWLPGMMKEFLQIYPGIRFQLLHGNNDQVVQWISDGKVDLGFTRYGTAALFYEVFLHRDPIVGVFAADEANQVKPHLFLEELQDLPYIALNEGVDDEITDILRQSEIHLKPSFTESDDHAVIAMVEQGLGVSLMSQMMLQGFQRNIVAIPLNPPRFREIGMACRDKNKMSAAASAFMDHVEEWVKRWQSQR